MSQIDKELKMYAENGLRIVADWYKLGRDIEPGSKPRSTVNFRGVPTELFTRDQTLQRVKAARRVVETPVA